MTEWFYKATNKKLDRHGTLKAQVAFRGERLAVPSTIARYSVGVPIARPRNKRS